MTDQPPPAEREGQDALEAAEMGEKPDRGHKADTLIDALDGSDSVVASRPLCRITAVAVKSTRRPGLWRGGRG